MLCETYRLEADGDGLLYHVLELVHGMAAKLPRVGVHSKRHCRGAFREVIGVGCDVVGFTATHSGQRRGQSFRGFIRIFFPDDN